MTVKLIYKSPKSKVRSGPVAEDDHASRARLEAMGWTVVERIGGDDTAPVEPVAPANAALESDVLRLVYQSPRAGKKRSAPIDANDKAARARLQAMGWQVVERIQPGERYPTPVDDSGGAYLNEQFGQQAAAKPPKAKPPARKPAERSAVIDDTDNGEQSTEPTAHEFDALDDGLAEQLLLAGYASFEDIRQASDQDLLKVKGVGKARLATLREVTAPAAGEETGDE